MFVDKAKIFVKGGDGGNGLISYRREKFVPMGGPAGGDGGRGADVIFIVDEGLRTLMDFRFQRHFKATRGEHGKTKSQHGAGSKDMIVKVPPGTIVVDDDSDEVLVDLLEHGDQWIAAKGGKGGRGNSRFATQNNPAPDYAENGELGQERWIRLELKLLADAGLIGFPSVGKSTLLSMVSAAKPKIGDYPFTTIAPNLGVVSIEEGESFVLADLPGLIEGAHQGTGLGLEFLRHIERTKLLIHVVDMAGVEGRDPYSDWQTVQQELLHYDKMLAARPQIIAANKMEMPEAQEHLIAFKEKITMDEIGRDLEILEISAITGQGIKALMYRVAQKLNEMPNHPPVLDKHQEVKVYRHEDTKPDTSFVIRRVSDRFIVQSDYWEQRVRRMRMGSEQAVMRLSTILKNAGLDKALREKGAKDGHMVELGKYEFEFVEHGQDHEDEIDS